MLVKTMAGVLALLAACHPQRIAEPGEGVSTQADVRARFGEPETIRDGAGGERILEYKRQQADHENYMIGTGRAPHAPERRGR